jgi:hypothetical protein
LSFREFLEYEYGVKQEVVTVDEIVANHQDLAMGMMEK